MSLLSPSVGTLGFSLADPAPPLAEVVKQTRPRYVFWGEGEGFWEREPLGWAGSDGKEERWTRAVKLGALGGEEPQDVKKPRVCAEICSRWGGWAGLIPLVVDSSFIVVLRLYSSTSNPDRPITCQTGQYDS